MGNLLPWVKDKIIDQNNVEQLYFEDVICYFQNKYKEDRYMQLAGVRSQSNDKQSASDQLVVRD